MIANHKACSTIKFLTTEFTKNHRDSFTRKVATLTHHNYQRLIDIARPHRPLNYRTNSFSTLIIDEFSQTPFKPQSSEPKATRISDEETIVLNQLKQKMSGYNANGMANDALNVAIEMMDRVGNNPAIGKQSALYASFLNNAALMNKNLGNNKEAIDQYSQALRIYRDIYQTKNHPSYAATLSNLGVVYKTMGEFSKGLDKASQLDLAEAALTEALSIRESLFGKSKRETMLSAVNLAALWRVNKKQREAEELLLNTLTLSKEANGGKDLLTATIFNNLGLIVKEQKRYAEAKTYYHNAIVIRKNILGEGSSETIVAMHNMAELLLAEGSEEEAKTLQNKILEITEKQIKPVQVNYTDIENAKSKDGDNVKSSVKTFKDMSVIIQKYEAPKPATRKSEKSSNENTKQPETNP